jgi:hypothetical protein
LTPHGWATGSFRFYGRVQGVPVQRPADAVETWEQHCEQSSAWSREDRTMKMVWHDPAVSQADRDALKARFSEPF